jgi:hypothetical protein
LPGRHFARQDEPSDIAHPLHHKPPQIARPKNRSSLSAFEEFRASGSFYAAHPGIFPGWTRRCGSANEEPTPERAGRRNECWRGYCTLSGGRTDRGSFVNIAPPPISSALLAAASQRPAAVSASLSALVARLLLLLTTCVLVGMAARTAELHAQVSGCESQNPTPHCPPGFTGPTGATFDIKQTVSCSSPNMQKCCKVGWLACTWTCTIGGDGVSRPGAMSCSNNYCRDQRGGVNCCDNPNWCAYP